MKSIIFGTTNNNKINRIKRLLKDINIEIISLDKIGMEIKEPEETSSTCVGIASEKALNYVLQLSKDSIVLTQDDTIIFERVEEEDNPGDHIKEPVIRKYGIFTDDNAIKYYTDLANKYGGTIPMTFHYGHAIALKKENSRKTIKIVASESVLAARLVNKVNKQETVTGYFMSAIMQVNINGEWLFYNDLTEEQLVVADKDLYDSITLLLKEVNVDI